MESLTRAQTIVFIEAIREAASEGTLSVRVSGDCMEPLVRAGARVTISGQARFYWPGDAVAVFTGRSVLALHRVIGCYRSDGQWKFITQGDKIAQPDAAVSFPQILGRVCGGECSSTLVKIPLRSRFRAFVRFLASAINIKIAMKISRGIR